MLSSSRQAQIGISKFETNSNDKNINDQNIKRHRAKLLLYILNFEHLNFDIVSDFDIRILTAVMMLRQHVELPKSNTELLGQRTIRCQMLVAGYLIG